jgi:hypothetical protein
MESRAKPGTRPKGDRRAITVRVPRSQWAIFDGARKRAGYQSLSDYVTALLAEHHGLDVPDYARLDDPDQEALLRVG